MDSVIQLHIFNCRIFRIWCDVSSSVLYSSLRNCSRMLRALDLEDESTLRVFFCWQWCCPCFTSALRMPHQPWPDCWDSPWLGGDEEGPEKGQQGPEGKSQSESDLKETKTTCQVERAKVKVDPNWDFLGGPVVKTLHFHRRGTVFLPGRGTKIPYAVWYNQN